MTIIGNLTKLRVRQATPVEYTLVLNEKKIFVNELLNKTIQLTFTGQIHCIQCGRKTKKSFQQGYCFPCLRRLQECQLCIIHPERCLVEQGTCPHDDWAHEQCHQSHHVYLAISSGLKIGMTRKMNIPSRWIDQGAIQALSIFETSNRYQAGLIEVIFKKYVSDRTNWRHMLTNNVQSVDLIAERERLFIEAHTQLQVLLDHYSQSISSIDTNVITTFKYPVLQYPIKIKSLSFDKTPMIRGKLLGIKGQYLIFDNGVLNVRKFGGYEVELVIE